MLRDIRLPKKRRTYRMGESADFYRIRRRLGIALVALVGVTVVGIIGFLLIGGGEYGVIDALYMTMITLTTVGFGEIINMAGNPAGRLFTIFLILGGMGIVTYSMLNLAAFVIEGQLRHVFARRRMDKIIDKMNDMFRISYEFFYSPKRESAVKAFKLYKEIKAQIEENLGAKSKEMVKALISIEFSVRIIYHLTTMRLDTLKELRGNKQS